MTPRPIRVFLFLGQSNIAGADAVVKNGAAGFIQQEADQACLLSYGPGPGDEGSAEYVPWGSLKGHRLSSRAHPQGFVIGPEVGFCRQLFSKSQPPIAIIKCCGNIVSAEDEWLWCSGKAFFLNSVAFIKRRLDELVSAGWEPALCGVVWDQGIDDGFNETRAKGHAANLRDFIASIREHFGQPELPFILSRSIFSPLANPQWMKGIRNDQIAVAGATKGADWINVDDLEKFEPHHMTAQSQLKAGRRFALAYQDVVRPTTAGSFIRRWIRTFAGGNK